jgi:hypothetical protein
MKKERENESGRLNLDTLSVGFPCRFLLSLLFGRSLSPSQNPVADLNIGNKHRLMIGKIL